MAVPSSQTLVARIAALALALCSVTGGARAAPDALTLDEALALARQANARLPLSIVDVATRQAALREASAQRWVRGSVVGSVAYAPPGAGSAYADNADEYILQLVARQPLYAGGELSAQIGGSRAQVDAARARLRAAEKDLELAVTSGYYDVVRDLDEIAFRKQGLERLRAYSVSIRDRLAAGQGVQSDLLRTGVRIADDEAALAAAERRLAIARLELNELLGRDPAVPLTIAVPPALPSPPAPRALPATTGASWSLTPELAEGRAEVAAAHAEVARIRADRRPHLELVARAGLWQTGQSQTTGTVLQQLRQWTGYSFGLTLSWNIFDIGLYRARVEQARLAEQQAQIGRELLRRQARLEWDRASAALDGLYRELVVRADNAPKARDSYLLADSLYRGGSATALEVLDAYDGWISAEEALAATLFDYRVAAATRHRWSTP